MAEHREQKIISGDYLEVEIYKTHKSGRRIASAYRGMSTEEQKNLNDKNARKRVTRLANANFTPNDIHFTGTYVDETLPQTWEDAHKDVKNFIRRYNYARSKFNLPPCKYIAVVEFKEPNPDGKPVRLHHHIILEGSFDAEGNEVITRDEIEQIWKKKTKGRANTGRLQFDEYGITGLANYITKDPAGKKRWIPSRNLEEPITPKPKRIGKKWVEHMKKYPDDRTFFQERYKGYIFNDCVVTTNEFTGDSVYIRMRRE